MGRPPMPVGTYGKITTRALGDGQHMARCRFRDFDGTVRQVTRLGKTKTAATNSLTAALRDRQGPTGDGITRETKLSKLAELLLSEVDGSDRSTGTKQHYRYVANTYVLPAVGNLRIGEATIGPLDRALTTISEKHGKGSAKSTRTVLSLMFQLAGRYGAVPANPVRDTSRITSDRKRARSLTRDDEDAISDALRSMPRAVELDLPDLVDTMLGTGARIGEACAMRDALNSDREPILDLDAGTWEINATVIRVAGAKRRKALESKAKLTWEEQEELAALLAFPPGLRVQERPKSAAGWRVLALPPYVVSMIGRRRTELRLQGPQGVVFGSPQARALRDPSNTPGDLRAVLDAIQCPTCEGAAYLLDGRRRLPCPDAGPFGWVTSHTFRKTVATRLEVAGLTPRQVADHLGHANPSMTLDVYFGRSVVTAEAARILER